MKTEEEVKLFKKFDHEGEERDGVVEEIYGLEKLYFVGWAICEHVEKIQWEGSNQLIVTSWRVRKRNWLIVQDFLEGKDRWDPKQVKRLIVHSERDTC